MYAIWCIYKKSNKQLDGCTPWEFDAAQEFSNGLHQAIINHFGGNDDLSGEKIKIEVAIKEANKDFGTVHISGAIYTSLHVNADTVSSEMDKLLDTILESAYGSNKSCIRKHLQDKYRQP